MTSPEVVTSTVHELTHTPARSFAEWARYRFAPSTARGRPTGPWLRGRAALLDGDDATHAATLINRRYPLLQGAAVRLYHRLRRYRTLHYRISDIAREPGLVGAPATEIVPRSDE